MSDIKAYQIMSGDTVCALWDGFSLTVTDEKLLPLYLKRIKNADMWLETRAIDSHRANSRLLKRALRLTERDDRSTVLHSHGATITDNYWVRPFGEDSKPLPLTYSDVRFGDDYFAVLALRGDLDSFNRAALSGRTKTPELTNIGSFEKCWRLDGGRWVMYKRANEHELFSELFVYRLGVALGFRMAEYERGDGFIKSPDFTNGASVNFEPASAFMGDNDDYSDTVARLEALCPRAIPDYVRMIFLDTLCANPDRHTNNFGLLRAPESGELLTLAPNFDNNMALIARGYPSSACDNDLLIELFRMLMTEHPEYCEYIPPLKEATVREIITRIGIEVDAERVTELLMNRYNKIIISN